MLADERCDAVNEPDSNKASRKRKHLDRDDGQSPVQSGDCAEACAGRDAKNIRRNEGIAEQALIGRPRRRQSGADGNGGQHTRNANIPDGDLSGLRDIEIDACYLGKEDANEVERRNGRRAYGKRDQNDRDQNGRGQEPG